jgi:hypothetical protein
MRLHLDTKTYTNFILSVIALLLLANAIPMVADLRAQDAEPQITPPAASRFSRPGRSAPLDLGNVAQVQDSALAAATTDVAMANRDIAAAIRELARSVSEVRGGLEALRPVPGGAVSGAAASAPVVRGSGSVVEVGPPATR